MPECRKLQNFVGPACGCPEHTCVLEIDDQQWPYDPNALQGSIDDTLDENLEGEMPLVGWTLVKPHGIKLHQRTFSLSRSRSVSAEDPDKEWEEEKLVCLKELLENNGFKLTFDTYTEPAVDAIFGRWTLEEVTT